MTQKNLILEYFTRSMPHLHEVRIRLYENGEVDVVEFLLMDEVDREKKLKIPPEQVCSYAERLIQEGFFDFQDIYGPSSIIYDGIYESITLNYQGKFKHLTRK